MPTNMHKRDRRQRSRSPLDVSYNRTHHGSVPARRLNPLNHREAVGLKNHHVIILSPASSTARRRARASATSRDETPGKGSEAAATHCPEWFCTTTPTAEESLSAETAASEDTRSVPGGGGVQQKPGAEARLEAAAGLKRYWKIMST